MKRCWTNWSRWPLLRAAARAGAALALCLPALHTAQALNLTPAARVTTPQVQAELLAHAPEGVGPGKPMQLGLRLTHQPGWHTYWKNPGDSGLPVTLQWTLPPGLSAGDIRWPTPQRIPIGDLANYGYEGQVLLPVPLRWTGGAAASAEALTLRLKANWLVCRRECIPEEGEFALQLPQGGTGARHTAEFEQAARASPRPAAGASARGEATGQSLQLQVQGLPEALRGQPLALFVETPELIATAAQPEQQWQGANWTARVPLSAYRSASPTHVPLVLAAEALPGRPAVAVTASIQGAWPAAPASSALPAGPAAVPAAGTGLSPALAAALAANARAPVAALPPSGSDLGLVAALLGALVGGLLLNLMPCVFPVLGIKLLALAAPGQAASTRRAAGLAYTAGVLLSFLALGALMLGLRSAGEQLGWGFQLQSPAVVSALALLFTLLGLNLAGLFEFGRMLPSGWAGLQLRHPALDAALSGVLAVAVASPCTAPFMGASLGLALGLPAPAALAVFATMGLGMALPYLAASLLPGLARALPRPGPWMQTLRQALAFPMLATVVWLLWVLGRLSGMDVAAALLATLLALAFVLWSLGRKGRERGIYAIISIAVLLISIRVFATFDLQSSPLGPTPQASGRWEPWTPQTQAEALARGETVFVDFTAAWCITCQYNKQTTLADAALLGDFAARRVRLLRADWTRRDPDITAALAALGRSGVPVYLLQAPGRPAVLLSELPSVQEVRSALARL